jgi:DNA polymerase-3 subunit gamma/tau
LSYLVLARKWRPQQFENVVGQDHVVTTLKNAISMNRVAHAYLFSGPRGVGKTSTARIFAKALNCKKEMTADPCDKCANCSEISAGTSLDVMEIDGASNRGIDQVRELRDNVKFTPASSRFKIYIIDEVHMLTQEAFNALLKTLEEPPAHVKFFFATTEAHRVPATILSRCQRFDLRKISTKEIFDSLKKIVKQEKIKADDRTLFAVAKGADGSLRDAESLLDQLISFSQGDLRYEDAVNILGWVPREEVIKFVELLKEGDWKNLFSLIRQLDYDGKDTGVFIGELTSHLRDLLILAVGPNEVDLIELSQEDLEKLKVQSKLFSKDQLLQMLEVSLETEDRLKFAVSKRSMLEALAVRLYLISQSVTLENLLEKLESAESGAEIRPSGEVRSGGPSSEPPVKKNSLPRSETSALEPQRVSADPWEKVLEGIAKRKPLIHAYLKEAVPYWEGERCRLLFTQAKSFFIETLQSAEYLNLIREEVQIAFGIKVNLELGFLPGEEQKVSKEKEPSTSEGISFQDDPVVQKALEIFQGKITEIKREI